MLFYFGESFFFSKKIEKYLKEHTFSSQMCFVSPEYVISAKKGRLFCKVKS
jgi:hypothetical protein